MRPTTAPLHERTSTSPSHRLAHPQRHLSPTFAPSHPRKCSPRAIMVSPTFVHPATPPVSRARPSHPPSCCLAHPCTPCRCLSPSPSCAVSPTGPRPHPISPTHLSSSVSPALLTLPPLLQVVHLRAPPPLPCCVPSPSLSRAASPTPPPLLSTHAPVPLAPFRPPLPRPPSCDLTHTSSSHNLAHPRSPSPAPPSCCLAYLTTTPIAPACEHAHTHVVSPTPLHTSTLVTSLNNEHLNWSLSPFTLELALRCSPLLRV